MLLFLDNCELRLVSALERLVLVHSPAREYAYWGLPKEKRFRGQIPIRIFAVFVRNTAMSYTQGK